MNYRKLLFRQNPARTSMAILIVVAGAALFTNTASAADTYYRWVDERGETILSDRPPAPGTDYEVVNTKSGLSSTAGNAGEPEENEATAAVAATAKSKKSAELCRIAMENYDALNNSDRITMRDENGNAKVLTEQEIKEHFKTTKQQIEAFCE